MNCNKILRLFGLISSLKMPLKSICFPALWSCAVSPPFSVPLPSMLVFISSLPPPPLWCLLTVAQVLHLVAVS